MSTESDFLNKPAESPEQDRSAQNPPAIVSEASGSIVSAMDEIIASGDGSPPPSVPSAPSLIPPANAPPGSSGTSISALCERGVAAVKRVFSLPENPSNLPFPPETVGNIGSVKTFDEKAEEVEESDRSIGRELVQLATPLPQEGELSMGGSPPLDSGEEFTDLGADNEHDLEEVEEPSLFDPPQPANISIDGSQVRDMQPTDPSLTEKLAAATRRRPRNYEEVKFTQMDRLRMMNSDGPALSTAMEGRVFADPQIRTHFDDRYCSVYAAPDDYKSHINEPACQCNTCIRVRAAVRRRCTGVSKLCPCAYHLYDREIPDVMEWRSLYEDLFMNYASAPGPIFKSYRNTTFLVREGYEEDFYDPPEFSPLATYDVGAYKEKAQYAEKMVDAFNKTGNRFVPDISVHWAHPLDDTIRWFSSLRMIQDTWKDTERPCWKVQGSGINSWEIEFGEFKPQRYIGISFMSLPQEAQAMLTAHPDFPFGLNFLAKHKFPDPVEDTSGALRESCFVHCATEIVYMMTASRMAHNGFVDAFSGVAHKFEASRQDTYTHREPYYQLFIDLNVRSIPYGRVSYPSFFAHEDKIPMLLYSYDPSDFFKMEYIEQLRSHVLKWEYGVPLYSYQPSKDKFPVNVQLYVDDFKRQPFVVRDTLFRTLSRYPLLFSLVPSPVDSEPFWARFLRFWRYPALPHLDDILITESDAMTLCGISRNLVLTTALFSAFNAGPSKTNIMGILYPLADYTYSSMTTDTWTAMFSSSPLPMVKNVLGNRITLNFQAILSVSALVFSTLEAIEPLPGDPVNISVKESFLHNSETIAAVLATIGTAACLSNGVRAIQDYARTITAIKTIFSTFHKLGEITLSSLYGKKTTMPVLKPSMTDKQIAELAPYLFMDHHTLHIMLTNPTGVNLVSERYFALHQLYKSMPFIGHFAPLLQKVREAAVGHPFTTSLIIIVFLIVVVYSAYKVQKGWPSTKETIQLMELIQTPFETLKGVALQGEIIKKKVGKQNQLFFRCTNNVDHKLYVFVGGKTGKFVPATRVGADVVMFVSAGNNNYIPLLNLAMLPECKRTDPKTGKEVDVPVTVQINDLKLEGRRKARPYYVKATDYSSWYADDQKPDVSVTDDYTGPKVKGWDFPDYFDTYKKLSPKDEWDDHPLFGASNDFAKGVFKNWADYESKKKPSMEELDKIACAVAKEVYGLDEGAINMMKKENPLWWKVHQYMTIIQMRKYFRENPKHESLSGTSHASASLTDIARRPPTEPPKPKKKDKSLDSKTSDSDELISNSSSKDPPVLAKIESAPSIVAPTVQFSTTPPSSVNSWKKRVKKESKFESVTDRPVVPFKLIENAIFQLYVDEKMTKYTGTAFAALDTIITAQHVFKGTGYKHPALYFTLNGKPRKWLASDTKVVGNDVVICTDANIIKDLANNRLLPVEVDDRTNLTSTVIGFYPNPGNQKGHLQFSTGGVHGSAHNMSTENGVSGSPIFNDRYRVFAIHLSGGTVPTFPNGLQRITAEMIKLFPKSRMEIASNMRTIQTKAVPQARIYPRDEHGYEEFLTPDQHVPIPVWGYNKEYVSTYGDRTVPDPDFQDFLAINPSLRRPLMYMRAARNPLAEGNGIAKLSRKFPPFIVTPEWEKAVQMMRDCFTPMIAASHLTPIETVIEVMNKQASAGVVWKQYKNAGEMVEAERPAIDEYLKLLTQPNAPASLFKATAKDELRHIDKVKRNQTRIFMIASKEHYIAQCHLSFDQNERMTKYAKTHPSCVSAVGLSGIPLAHHIGEMIPRYQRLICMDVKGFDSNLNFFMFSSVAQFRFDCLLPKYQTPEVKMMFGNIYRDVFFSPTALPNGAVVFLEHGPSGHASTTYDNTMILYMVLSWVWIRCGGTPSVEAFNGKVKMFLYGDDSTLLFDDDVYTFFNEKTITDALNEIGWQVEFSDDAEFLGHSIKYSKVWQTSVAVFPEDKMYARLYIKSTENPTDTIAKANSIRLEAFSNPEACAWVTKYVQFLVQRYNENLSWQEDSELVHEYFRSPYDEAPLGVKMFAAPEQNSNIQTHMNKQSRNQSTSSNSNSGNKRRSKNNKGRGGKNLATSAQVNNLQKQVAKLELNQVHKKAVKKNRQNVQDRLARAPAPNVPQDMRSGLRAGNPLAMGERYANCLALPGKYPCRIPDSGGNPSSLIRTSRNLEIYVPTTGPAAGRFTIFVQPKIGAPDAPAHYSIGLVDYTNGEPANLSEPLAWQNNNNVATSIDSTAVWLTNNSPSFLSVAANFGTTAGSLNNRPFNNWFYDTIDTGPAAGLQLTFDSTFVERQVTRTINGASIQGSLCTIDPGVYFGVLRTRTSVAVNNAAGGGNQVMKIVVESGGKGDVIAGTFVLIEATGSSHNFQYQQFVLSITKRDSFFVYYDPTTVPLGCNLETIVMNLTPTAIPNIAWNQDEGVIDKVRPVGCAVLFSSTMSPMLANGQIVSARVPAGNLGDLLTGDSPIRLNTINALSKISPSIMHNGPLAKGTYVYYAPSDATDRMFYTPSQHNEKEYPFLLINGSMNVTNFQGQPGEPFHVGRIIVDFVYEFMHTTQLYPTNKTGGSSAAIDYANNRVAGLKPAVENPKHGDLVAHAGSTIGHGVDFAESLFGLISSIF